jgi:hypothetical protein
MSDRVKLAREIAARTKPRFIEIPRERRKSITYTEEQITAMRGVLTADEYRVRFWREWSTLRVGDGDRKSHPKKHLGLPMNPRSPH